MGLTGYICYDKFYTKEEAKGKGETTEKKDVEGKEELAPWLDYLLNTDGVKITKIVGDAIDFEGDSGRHEDELSINQLSDILTGTVKKYINPCGRGGITEGFEITYTKDGVEYKTGSWGATSNNLDSDFLTAVEKSVTESKDYTREDSGCDPRTIIDIDFDSDKLLKYLTD